MAPELILASESEIRKMLLRQAGVRFRATAAQVDEDGLRAGLVAEGAASRDIAAHLAEHKARKISGQETGALVLGIDQILDMEGEVFAKADTPGGLRRQLDALMGRQHDLLAAAVICEGGAPVWRHVGRARMTMRQLSESYMDDYVARNWQAARHSVGGYLLESEGIRLFSAIEGDWFSALGMPLKEVLGYLMTRGVIPR